MFSRSLVLAGSHTLIYTNLVSSISPLSSWLSSSRLSEGLLGGGIWTLRCRSTFSLSMNMAVLPRGRIDMASSSERMQNLAWRGDDVTMCKGDLLGDNGDVSSSS